MTGKNRQSGSQKPSAPVRGLAKIAKATRSGLRRYPRAIINSVCGPRGCRITGDPIADMASHRLAAAWLGHASVLVRAGHMNIMADPVFAERIGVSVGPLTLGLPRLSPVPCAEEHLPPLDLILITHAHFDHLDKPTLRRLAHPRTVVVTSRRTANLIPRGFGEVVELDWGCTLRIGDNTLQAVRPAHWGARTALDRDRGYNSYIVRPSSGGGVLLAGDTAYTDAFDKIDDLALAVLGIGAYEPWEHAHATPEQAWAMFKACRAGHMLPVHHSTFPLGDEHVDEPMRRLLAAAGDDHPRIIQAKPGAVWAA